jgi:regulator of nucleoside diphosphate kinase
MSENSEVGDLRPQLLISAKDYTRLAALAKAATRLSPLVARLLAEEVDRAEVVSDGQVPAGIVAVGSLVEFRDETTGEVRSVQVVLPGEADIASGRISVLSLVGVGLMGLSEGHSIDWPTQDGRIRRLTVLRVDAPLAEVGRDNNAPIDA